jgi:hypothetical protein
VSAVKSGREQAEEKRQAKLESVREQVENGSLVIRPMTDEERERYPPRPRKARRGEEPPPVEEAQAPVADGAADGLDDEPEPDAD